MKKKYKYNGTSLAFNLANCDILCLEGSSPINPLKPKGGVARESKLSRVLSRASRDDV
jgi:hypothetical protein